MSPLTRYLWVRSSATVSANPTRPNHAQPGRCRALLPNQLKGHHVWLGQLLSSLASQSPQWQFSML
jgi:hypothetical protein